MNWQEVCASSALQNLPFKIELNERGQILMSPVRVYHSAYQAEISNLLNSILKTGKTLVECAIKTRQGTKVADVVWATLDRFNQIKHETECSVAPEICVEVLSDTNTDEEMKEKRKLYFENKAMEVWICTQDGTMTFYSPKRKLKYSLLVPEFPNKVEF